MEVIKYTNFLVDEQVYGNYEIVGLVDMTGEFLYETMYDIKVPTFSSFLSVSLYLNLGNKNRKLTNILLSEFEIDRNLLNRPLSKLSSSELVKILLIKVATGDAKTIILDSIDTYLNYNDFTSVLKTLKSHIKEIDKTVIFSTNKVDNILSCDRYIIANDGSIIYNGNDIASLPIETETASITNLANKKGAKLDYYKDVNDLLKAIYRSVQ